MKKIFLFSLIIIIAVIIVIVVIGFFFGTKNKSATLLLGNWEQTSSEIVDENCNPDSWQYLNTSKL